MAVSDLWMVFGVFAVAMAYSMVGHGGASGYLALWTFTRFAAPLGATMALVLNLCVAGLSFVLFRRARHFDWKLTWPFLVLSVPLAYVGGSLARQSQWQNVVLALVLTYAAIALVVRPKPSAEPPAAPALPISLLSGGGIGLLSGIVGVGGGIFLSPLMILRNWARPHTVAATSAVFIFANSIAGLAARPAGLLQQSFELWPLLVAGAGGALLGGWLGANRTSSQALRTALAVVLLLAVAKHVSKAVGV